MWRFKALNEAGGWKDRTTVEDMDLAVRASLKGWKFVFVGDIEVCYNNQMSISPYDKNNQRNAFCNCATVSV